MTLLRIMCAAGLSLGLLHARDLEINWTDVEGGGATLIVSPSGQALLVDTGFPGNGDRDAKRIADTIKSAGLKKIDVLEITHYHGDHVGGAAALSKLVPIDKFYDHGDSIEASTPQGAQLYDSYKALAGSKRVTVKPGDKIPLSGVDITVVSANGEVISKAINGGGGANEYCKDAQTKPEDKTENSRSVGFLLTYGKFKFLDLGDLTWDRELMLACPANKIGTVTLFQATHHGFSNGASGSPAFVWAIKPQVVIVNDGARKGFNADAYETIAKIPGIEGIWQLHRAVASDAAHNTSEQMIANVEEGAADQGKGIKVFATKDGKFTVTNARNAFSKNYAARQ
ncbi:MAG: MBL fold metallo-hydrolase [Bryobacterales bacterium]|nr:MBL fold metallo-hydrolase [Bryobacterales bacterium]MBV9401946.1 MBL fold metallo-hydrolase [Bryobacterales bacterium]